MSESTIAVEARPRDPSRPAIPVKQVSLVRGPSILQRLASGGAGIVDQVRSMPAQLSAKALGLPLEYESSSFEDSPSSSAAIGKRITLRGAILATRFITALGGPAKEQEPAAKTSNAPTEIPKGEVSALLEQHAGALHQMVSELASDPLFRAEEHDALWLLRFLLSASGKTDKAIKNAAACLKWRAENGIDAIAAKVRSTPWNQWPGYRAVQSFTADHVTHPDPDKGTVVFKRMAENDFDGLFGGDPALRDEDWVLYQFHLKEWLYQRRDATSRRTGGLAKNIVIVDMGGLSRKHLGSKRYKALMTHPAIKTADEMYPQALGAIVLVNLPGALSFLFNTIVKPLAPSKVQEKIRVASNPKKEYARLELNLDDIPSEVGGNLTTWPPDPDARHQPP